MAKMADAQGLLPSRQSAYWKGCNWPSEMTATAVSVKIMV